MAEPNRILIVRPSALGDVCRTVPVLATLRRAWPSARIDWVVQSEFAPAVAAHPALDEVVPFPRHDFGRWWRPDAALGLARWLGGLRARRYDVVYDCQGLGRSGLITWATGAPRRVGLRSARELGWLGYTVRHPAPADRHAVEQMMAIPIAEGLTPVYDMRLYAGEADRAWWRESRAELGIEGRAYAVLAPTARWAAKRWPWESWSALVEPLVERGFHRVVLVGAPGEEGQVARISEHCSPDAVTDLVGRTTTGQTLAVIAEAGLVIANDSAPLHMAVGFARPCLGLFGPTDPNRVGPWHAEDAVVRPEDLDGALNHKDRRLGDSVMRRIQPGQVIERIDAVLEKHRSPAVVEIVAREQSR